MNRPEQDKLDKLPKWAQDYINGIERERETAIRALNGYLDGQTESPFYIDELERTGEQPGPSHKRRYIQARRMVVNHGGVELTIYLRDKEAIEMQYESRTGSMAEVALIPRSFQNIALKAVENLRRKP